MQSISEALLEAGYPYTQFDVDNVDEEYKRLLALDVEFSVKPKTAGTVKYAIFNDTCGNNIQLVENLQIAFTLKFNTCKFVSLSPKSTL